MSSVVMDVSVSLDGFTAGPGIGPEAPMGEGGEQLHEWMFREGPGSDADRRVRRGSDATIGAALTGRRTFDLGLEPWGGTPWAGVPTFVVTHRPREGFTGANGGTFAFGSMTDAVRLATRAAGDKDVSVLGAGLAGHLISAGLLDEIRIHLVPVLLGGGTPLFAGGLRATLTPAGEPIAGTVTHLRYRVRKP